MDSRQKTELVDIIQYKRSVNFPLSLSLSSDFWFQEKCKCGIETLGDPRGRGGSGR